MHPGQLDLRPDDIVRLIAAQFPQWAGLAVVRLPSDGTVNAMFRLGADLVVRAPLLAAGSGEIEREARVLESLAPVLSVRVPRVVAVGVPDARLPYLWSVLEWVPGSHPDPERLDDELGLADDLAAFLAELGAAALGDAPAGYRGGGLERLRHLDRQVRGCLAEAADLIEADRLTAAWAEALAARPSRNPARWVHGDLLPSNLLVDERGRLAGVLDWATAGAGDTSADLLAAWNVLGSRGRDRLRDRLDIDDDTWLRGRGWALSQAAIALPYYRDTNPGMRRMALRALGELARET